jgi:hypothetical protein
MTIVEDGILIFTKEDAEEIAAETFRFRYYQDQGKASAANRPLAGKENQLLEALNKAAAVYWDWMGVLEGLRKFHDVERSLSRKCSELVDLLQQSLSCLAALDVDERAEFDFIAEAADSSVTTIEEQLAHIVQSAHDVQIKAKRPTAKRGRKPGIGKNDVWFVPLEEFAKVIRNFWISVTGDGFTFDQAPREDLGPHIREPASESARLLFFAARKLEKRIEIAHIESVIEAVEQNPRFRPERWDNDPDIISVIG